eukprot:352421-Chlamydomonas_euryale.AAC.6
MLATQNAALEHGDDRSIASAWSDHGVARARIVAVKRRDERRGRRAGGMARPFVRAYGRSGGGQGGH